MVKARHFRRIALGATRPRKRRPDALRRLSWPAVCVYVAAAALLSVGYFFDTSTCLWHAITGLRCPGCGMIHAWLAMAHGNVRAAWNFNPSSFVVTPILLWTGVRKITGA